MIYIRRGNTICWGNLGKIFNLNGGLSLVHKKEFSSILMKKSIQYRIERLDFQICGLFREVGRGKSQKSNANRFASNIIGTTSRFCPKYETYTKILMYLFKQTQFKVKVEMRLKKVTRCIKIKLNAIRVKHFPFYRYLTFTALFISSRFH